MEDRNSIEAMLPSETLWAIERRTLERIQSAAAQVLSGELVASGLDARLVARRGRSGFEQVGSTAVLRLEGTLTRGLDMFSILFGGTSTEQIESDFRAAMDSPDISSILMVVDSPGGSVSGAPELASTIREARGRKPIVALVDSLAASAALWIASAADKLYMRGPTAITGSVGVIGTHVDFSRREEANGVRVTEVVSAPRKNLTSPHAPLSDEGRNSLQAQVDSLHAMFVQDLARNRRVSVETAARWGTGDLFFASDAIKLGIADGFNSQEKLLSELAVGTSSSSAKVTAALPVKAAAATATPKAATPQPTTKQPQQDLSLSGRRKQKMDMQSARKLREKVSAALSGVLVRQPKGSSGVTVSCKEISDYFYGHRNELLSAQDIFDAFEGVPNALCTGWSAPDKYGVFRFTSSQLPAPPPKPESVDFSSLTDRDRANLKWMTDQALRAKYQGNFAIYSQSLAMGLEKL